MKPSTELTVLACCAVVALLIGGMFSALLLPSRHPVDEFAAGVRWGPERSTPPGPWRDLQRMGAEKYGILVITAAAAVVLVRRRSLAAPGLRRLALLAVLVGTIGAAASATYLHQEEFCFYQWASGALAALRIGYGLAAILVAGSLVVPLLPSSGRRT